MLVVKAAGIELLSEKLARVYHQHQTAVRKIKCFPTFTVSAYVIDHQMVFYLIKVFRSRKQSRDTKVAPQSMAFNKLKCIFHLERLHIYLMRTSVVKSAYK